jgi:hypothetical protein
LGDFLKRLEVYTTIPPTPTITDIIVKVMVELLSVLALTTKQIMQGRFSKCAVTYVAHAQCVIEKFMAMLSGKDKIQDALERLDRLTKGEGLSVAAQTLGVVHGIAENIKVAIGGTSYFHDFSRIYLSKLLFY